MLARLRLQQCFDVRKPIPNPQQRIHILVRVCLVVDASVVGGEYRFYRQKDVGERATLGFCRRLSRMIAFDQVPQDSKPCNLFLRVGKGVHQQAGRVVAQVKNSGTLGG